MYLEAGGGNVVRGRVDREGLHGLVAGGMNVCEFEPSLDVGVEGVKEIGQLLHRVVYLPRSSEDRYFSFPYGLVITTDRSADQTQGGKRKR